jgi:hypothetical protein
MLRLAHHRGATQIPIGLAGEISKIPPTDQKLSMQQYLPPCMLAPLGLAGPSVPKIPKKFHQIALNKQEKIVKKKNLGKFVPKNIFLVAVGVSSKFLFRQP